MKRNLLCILFLFVVTVLFSALQKPVFLLWHASAAAEATALELAGVLYHGLTLDMTMAGYICALPIVLLLFATALPHRIWGIITRIWLYIAAAIMAVSFAVNLGLYEYWGFPLDASILQYLATPKEAMASVTAVQFIVQSVVAVIYFAIMAYSYRAIIKMLDTTVSAKALHRVVMAFVVLLFAGLDFLAIRGGVTTAVANVSKVYFSDKAILNHAAVQPTFSFISSVGDDDDFSRYNYADGDVCAANFARLAVVGAGKELLTTPRPNIVLILAESFGRSTIDEVVGGQCVAPNMQRFKGEGVWFENMIASSFRTDRGVLATLSGFCSQPTMSLMKYPTKAAKLPSLASALYNVGYTTAYIHGGDLNFTNMASYLYATGFERLVALKDLNFDAPTSKWGYADDVLADYFADYCIEKSQSAQPYFAVWQTLSSHEPFDVPVDCFEDKMLCSMNFADSCIAKVVERLRATEQWENTLVIIVADHAYNYPYGISASAVERHRIPMVWLGGAVKQSAAIDTFCSQSDLAATLLGQLEIDCSQFVMSRDIFAPKDEAFGYYTFNNGFGVVQADGATIYDCTTDSIISGDVSAKRETIGKTMLQTTYNIIDEL